MQFRLNVHVHHVHCYAPKVSLAATESQFKFSYEETRAVFYFRYFRFKVKKLNCILQNT